MNRSGPIRLVVGSTLLIAAGYASAFFPGLRAWGAWLLAIGASTLFLAVMLLGLVRPGTSLRRLAIPLGVTYLLLIGGLGLALALPPETADAPALAGGLPRRAALLLYGIGLGPATFLPLVYARTFDDITLRPEDLKRIREVRERQEEGG